MTGNKAVVYIEPGKVEVHDTPYPRLELRDGPGVNPANVGRKTPHGVILEVMATNICGSDQHMVRGRTTAPAGLVLGHEILGKVIETGPDVEFVKVGDVCSVPFNIACGRCRNCKEGKTGICLNVNPDRPGSAYGYVDMGGWVGGQAQYVLVPYADWNLLVFPDPDQADREDPGSDHAVGHLPDRLPRCVHRRSQAGLDRLRRRRRSRRLGGRTLRPAPRGGGRHRGGSERASDWPRPAASVARRSTSRREIPRTRSRTFSGCPRSTARSTRSGSKPMATAHDSTQEAPAAVLNSLMGLTAAGGARGHPRPLRHRGPRRDRRRRQDRIAVPSARPGMGQVAFVRHRSVPGHEVQPRLDDVHPARQGPDRRRGQRHRHPPRAAPEGYSAFDSGAAKKFVLDPNGYLGTAA